MPLESIPEIQPHLECLVTGKAGPGPSLLSCELGEAALCLDLPQPVRLWLHDPCSHASFLAWLLLADSALAWARLARVHWFGRDPEPVALASLLSLWSSLTLLGMKNRDILKAAGLDTLGKLYFS